MNADEMKEYQKRYYREVVRPKRQAKAAKMRKVKGSQTGKKSPRRGRYLPCIECGRPYGLEDPKACSACAKRLKDRVRNAQYYERVGKPRREGRAAKERTRRGVVSGVRIKPIVGHAGVPRELAQAQVDFINEIYAKLDAHDTAVEVAKEEAKAKAASRHRTSVPLCAPMNLGDGVPESAGGVVADEGLARFLSNRRKRIARLDGGSGAGRRAGVSDDVVRVNYRVRLAAAGRGKR